MTTQEVLSALNEVGTARRGQITEQWYTGVDKNGVERKQGPYYVWTWYDQGMKHTGRIRANEIEKARSEIEKGKQVEHLMQEFWRNAETAARKSEKKTIAINRLKPAKKSV